ncbi:S66 peptidase family protein [Lutibacter sp.]
MIQKTVLKLLLLVFLTTPIFSYAQEQQNNLIQPPYLKKGDTIAIVAPAGRLKNGQKEVEEAIKLVESWGLHVVLGAHVFEKNYHFAGTDDERASDFQAALDNPNIKAIWCARGGYGTVRIIDKLDYTTFKKHPKWIIGYSDVTALHNEIHNLGIESMHALMPISLPEKDEHYRENLEKMSEAIASFKKALFGKKLQYTIPSSKYNRLGNAKGQLVGGNLTLLHTMLGSRTSISTKNKILFFEEIGEYKYHIDRMLQSLKRAGYFENCKGVIVGGITKVRKNTTPFGKTVEALILEVLSEYDFPVVFDFPAGHDSDNRALILGRNVTLEVTKEKTKLKF